MDYKSSMTHSTTSPSSSSRWEALKTWGASMLTCGILAALAMLRPSLQGVATSFHQMSSIPLDSPVGYSLIVIGYLLLPGVGVVLMRRKRAVARTRAAVLSVNANDDEVPLPDTMHTSCPNVSAILRMLAPSVIERRVDAATTCVTWSSAPVQCAVCLSDVCTGDTARVLPCHHAFHKPCADLWLVTGSKNTCPMCMHPVYNEQPTTQSVR